MATFAAMIFIDQKHYIFLSFGEFFTIASITLLCRDHRLYKYLILLKIANSGERFKA